MPRAKADAVLAAARRSVGELRRADRLDPADAVTVALLLQLARRLDHADPDTAPAQVASLARALLATIRQLLGGAVDSDDSLGDLLAAIAGTVGHPENS